MTYPDDEWLRGHQWTPKEIEEMMMDDILKRIEDECVSEAIGRRVTLPNFSVTTDPPRTAEFTELMDPERWGEPLEGPGHEEMKDGAASYFAEPPLRDPGYDPYNSSDRPKWHGRLQDKRRMQEEIEVLAEIDREPYQ